MNEDPDIVWNTTCPVCGKHVQKEMPPMECGTGVAFRVCGTTCARDAKRHNMHYLAAARVNGVAEHEP